MADSGVARAARIVELLAAALLLVGLPGGVVWSSAVGDAMPGFLDPSEACELRFGTSDVHAETSTFPVAAACVSSAGGPVGDFIPRDEADRLTALGRAWMLASGLGLALFIASFAVRLRVGSPPGPRRSPSRRIAHAIVAALLGAVSVPAGMLLAVVGLFGAGALGGLAAIGALFVGVATTATLLDLGLGPHRNDPLGARLRGLALGGLALVPTLFVGTWVWGALLVGAMPATGLVFSLVVWSAHADLGTSEEAGPSGG